VSIWERTPWRIRWVIAAICNVYYWATRSPIRMTHWIWKQDIVIDNPVIHCTGCGCDYVADSLDKIEYHHKSCFKEPTK
jgi:hypothetical protein